MNQNSEFEAIPNHPKFPETLPTRKAATALNRAPQTLRIWACYGSGPIQPIRINGRLHWRVKDIVDLMQGRG